MTIQFVQPGATVDYRPTADTPAGTLVSAGGVVGVTLLDIKANELGALAIEGIFAFPKRVGAGETFTFGQFVLWDTVNEVAEQTFGVGLIFIGYCVEDAGEDDTVVRARLR